MYQPTVGAMQACERGPRLAVDRKTSTKHACGFPRLGALIRKSGYAVTPSNLSSARGSEGLIESAVLTENASTGGSSHSPFAPSGENRTQPLPDAPTPHLRPPAPPAAIMHPLSSRKPSQKRGDPLTGVRWTAKLSPRCAANSRALRGARRRELWTDRCEAATGWIRWPR